MKMTDEKRLNWLEKHQGFALVSDDDERWACICDGIQNCPLDKGPHDIVTSFFIEKDEWKTSIRDAIDYAIEEHEQPRKYSVNGG